MKNESSIYTSRDRRKNTIILTCICTAVFILHIWPVGSIDSFSVFNDEFGYWGAAAYFAGYDWSSAISHILYYSYGYSFILTPLFWIFDNPVHMYRAALVLNGLFLTCIVPISYSIGKKYYPSADRCLLMAISFCVAVYPAYLAQSSVAWCESLLYLICWVIFWLFTQLDEKSAPLWKFAVAGLLLSYAYMIHQRSVGILLAGIIVILVMIKQKNITRNQLIAFFICIGIMLAIHTVLKNDLQSNLWHGNVSSNDFSNQIYKIKNILSVDGLLKTISVFCGQLFYLGAASFLTVYIGFWTALKNGIDTLIQKQLRNPYPFLFLSLAFISILAISAVFMSTPDRADQVIYARYNEMLVGPLLLFGLLELFNNKKRLLLKIAVCCAMVALSGIVAVYAIKKAGLTFFYMINIPSFYWIADINADSLYQIIIVSILGAGILFLLSTTGRKFQVSNLVAIGLCCFFFIFNEYNMVSTIVVEQKAFNYSAREKITDYVFETDDTLPVYYILNNDFGNNREKDFFQLMMRNTSLICVNINELKEDPTEKFIIKLNNNEPFVNSAYLLDGYTLFHSSGKYQLWLSKEYALQNCISADDSFHISGDGSLQYTIPLSSFASQNRTDEPADFVQSDGKGGYLIYGPYYSLEQGGYQVSVDLELVSSTKDDLGTLDFTGKNGKTRLDLITLNQSDFDKNNRYTATMSAALFGTEKNVEIRCLVKEGVILKIHSVTLTRLAGVPKLELSPEDLLTQNGSARDHAIVSNGSSGYLVYGLYISMPAGSYSLKMEAGLLDYPQNLAKLAVVDVTKDGGKECVGQLSLQVSDFVDGVLEIELPFTLEENSENLEFRVFTYDGVELLVKDLSVVAAETPAQGGKPPNFLYGSESFK